jgi:hypothetical protein
MTHGFDADRVTIGADLPRLVARLRTEGLVRAG